MYDVVFVISDDFHGVKGFINGGYFILNKLRSGCGMGEMESPKEQS